MAKRGPNGTKLNGRPEFPMGEIRTGAQSSFSGDPDNFQAFRWDGRYQKGAMRAYRDQLRIDAELRNEVTVPERRRSARKVRELASLKEQRRLVSQDLFDVFEEKKCTCLASTRPRTVCICK